MLYRRLMRGFYPALAPSFSGYQRIGERERASGELDSPDGFDMPADGIGVEAKGGLGKRESPVRRPAARVVGQFDHPMLPVPPVRTAFCFSRTSVNVIRVQRKTMIPAVDFLSCYAMWVDLVGFGCRTPSLML